jgi:hypothetical protein
MNTPESSQVRDPATREISSTNKDDTEEHEGNNISNKDDEAQKDESNGDSLGKASNSLTSMSVTATARSKKDMM